MDWVWFAWIRLDLVVGCSRFGWIWFGLGYVGFCLVWFERIRFDLDGIGLVWLDETPCGYF